MIFLRVLYTVGWVFLVAIAPFIALFGGKFRRWWLARRAKPPAFSLDRPVLWLHCASVGEFEQGRPVLEYVASQLPIRPQILVTFFSPSGWERYRQSYPLADWIGALPSDLPWVVRDWIQTVRPTAVFFVKYDLWPNLLFELKKAGVPRYLLAAHVAPYPKGLLWWWKVQLFRLMDHLFVQTAADLERLTLAGILPVTVAGDSRAWRVKQIREEWMPISGIQEWIAGRFCIVAGSLWEADIQFLSAAYAQLKGLDICWILVPHEIRAKTLEYIQRSWPASLSLYSQTDWSKQYNTLVIDTMGLLAYLYAYAHLVWVGGGFGKGIHNILEAVIYGKPVFFGSNYQDFAEAQELIRRGIAESCRYPSAFSNAVRSFVKDMRRLRLVDEKAQAYFANLPNTNRLVWEVLQKASWVQALVS